MANKKETGVTTTPKTKEEVLATMPTIKTPEQLANFLNAAVEVENTDLKEETSNYMTLELETDYAFLVTGLGIMQTNTGEKEVVQFIGMDGLPKINGDAVFVSTVKKLSAKEGAAYPMLLKVCVGKEIKAAKGNYKDMQIFGY